MQCKKKFVWIVTALCNLVICGLLCIWLDKCRICEYVYLAGTVIFSLLYWFYWRKRGKIYLKEIGSAFTLCAMFGLQYLSNIKLQGILLGVLILWFAVLEYRK